MPRHQQPAAARPPGREEWSRLAILPIATAFVLWFTTGRADAQEVPNINARVNYVYAAQFGFGTYQVGGLNVEVYSLPISFTFDKVYRDWNLRLGLPITYGHFQFKTRLLAEQEDQTGQVTIKAQTHSLATEPKLQLDIPLFEGFRFSPLGAWGAGSTIDSTGSLKEAPCLDPPGEESCKRSVNTNESFFYTYQFGYTALYEHDWLPFKVFFGNALIWAGDEFFDNSNDIESYGTLRNGIEARHPLGFEIADRVPDAGLYFIYDYFFPSLEFTRVHQATLEVHNLFEVGVTVGSETPLDLPWVGDMLDSLRIGVAYQAGDGLDAVKLTTGFPF